MVPFDLLGDLLAVRQNDLEAPSRWLAGSWLTRQVDTIRPQWLDRARLQVVSLGAAELGIFAKPGLMSVGSFAARAQG